LGKKPELTAVLVYLLDWGRYADATIVTVMLLFFTFLR
jgi:hypothetical protein